MRKITIILLAGIILSGCINTGRYTMKNDQAPLRKPTTLEMNDATPRNEPIYPWSLKPYTVFGKKYYPMPSAQGYVQSGEASWYGRKFHGHDTANGEVYDMYAMTAAHKTLPIPSYVRVTNTSNGKSIIVRVNDRGPFHDGRIIDLSYSAAYALNMLNSGVANVQVEAIVVNPGQVWNDPKKVEIQTLPKHALVPIPAPTPTLTKTSTTTLTPTLMPTTVTQTPSPITTAKATEPPKQLQATKAQPADTSKDGFAAIDNAQDLFVQVLAASDSMRILDTAKRLSKLLGQPRQIPRENGIYKLRFGPLNNKEQAQDIINTLKNNGYPNAYMLYTAPSL